MTRTLGQTLIAVEQNVSSIFTKEDVVELLRNIEERVELSDEKKEEIVADIMQAIEYEEDNIIDKDDIRLTIDSQNYVTVDSCAVNFSAIRNAVRDIVINLD